MRMRLYEGTHEGLDLPYMLCLFLEGMVRGIKSVCVTSANDTEEGWAGRGFFNEGPVVHLLCVVG